MRIEAFAVKNFPPFEDLEVNLPSKQQDSKQAEVHIFTGQNGAGKTRILSLLAAALGNEAELNSRLSGVKVSAAVQGAFNQKKKTVWINGQQAVLTESNKVPSLEVLINRPDQLSAIANAWIHSLKGSSEERFQHKIGPVSAMAFRGVAQISDAEVTALNPIQIKELSSLLLFDKSADENKQIAQSLVNIKMAAAMDKLDDSTDIHTRATCLSDRLEEAISRITERRFRFSVTPYPKVGLKATWGGTSMKFNQLPDGLRCILGWLAACVAKLDALFPDHEDPLSIPLILLLDEPEGHLHPAWQRKLIPAAQALFPNGQFFVATHSPFVISSVNEGWIHVLRAAADGKVHFEKPRECSKGDSYVEIVEEVLGVKEWYDPESEALLRDFRQTKDAVLDGQIQREPELQAQAKNIAERSDSLSDLVGGEMRQFERMKQQAAARA